MVMGKVKIADKKKFYRFIVMIAVFLGLGGYGVYKFNEETTTKPKKDVKVSDEISIDPKDPNSLLTTDAKKKQSDLQTTDVSNAYPEYEQDMAGDQANDEGSVQNTNEEEVQNNVESDGTTNQIVEENRLEEKKKVNNEKVEEPKKEQEKKEIKKEDSDKNSEIKEETKHNKEKNEKEEKVADKKDVQKKQKVDTKESSDTKVNTKKKIEKVEKEVTPKKDTKKDIPEKKKELPKDLQMVDYSGIVNW